MSAFERRKEPSRHAGSLQSFWAQRSHSLLWPTYSSTEASCSPMQLTSMLRSPPRSPPSSPLPPRRGWQRVRSACKGTILTSRCRSSPAGRRGARSALCSSRSGCAASAGGPGRGPASRCSHRSPTTSWPRQAAGSRGRPRRLRATSTSTSATAVRIIAIRIIAGRIVARSPAPRAERCRRP